MASLKINLGAFRRRTMQMMLCGSLQVCADPHKKYNLDDLAANRIMLAYLRMTEFTNANVYANFINRVKSHITPSLAEGDAIKLLLLFLFRLNVVYLGCSDRQAKDLVARASNSQLTNDEVFPGKCI